MTENKFSKYLLYAIGEIVLVVIGILIALQINNWNEQKKALQLQNELLDLLVIDLEEKNQEIKDDIAVFSNYLDLYKTFKNKWEEENVMDSTNLSHVLRSFTQDHWHFNTTTPTFQSTSSSDLWKNIPDSLTRQISNLYYAHFGFLNQLTLKEVEYASHCKINFLAPNHLLDPTFSSTIKSTYIQNNTHELFSYMSLFENHFTSMKNRWETAGEEVAAIIENLTLFVDRR